MKTLPVGSLLRVAISFGTIAAILFLLRDKVGHAFNILVTEVRWPWFLVAVAAYVICLTLLSLRLYYVFRVQEIILSYAETFYLGLVGLFFNLFFPSAVGGDVAKAYYAYKHCGDKIASTTSVLLDRLMGFVALILMAIVALGLFSREVDDFRINQVVYLFLGLMIFSVFFFGSRRFARNFHFLSFLVPSPKWRQRLGDVYHAIYGYKRHLGILFLTLFLSFASQSLMVLIHYWLALSLGVGIKPWIFFILVPLIFIISMAPSVSGLGVREAGMIALFARYMTTERALALSLLLDILIYGFSLAAGIFYALRGGLKAKVIHEMEALE